MLRSLDVRGVGPTESMAFEFGPRLNLLTGDNGVGKSFVLELAWWALTGWWIGRPATPTRAGETRISVEVDAGQRWDASWVASRQRWQFGRLHGRGPSAIVVHMGVDGFTIFDPHRNEMAGVHDGESRDPLDAFRFDARAVWDGIEHQGKPVCNGLIRDWVSWMRSPTPAGTLDPFALMCAVLDALSDPDEPLRPAGARPLFLDDARDIPTLSSPWGGDDVPVVLASAGVRRILMLAYLLTWTWVQHARAATILQLEPCRQMCVLVDELELHLHPRWQRRIGPALLELAATIDPALELQVIATSHAPLVLASLETHVDPARDRLFNLDTQSGTIVIEALEWVKHGDATGWLTSPAFETSPYSIEAEQAMGWAEDFMAGRLDAIPDPLRERAALQRHLASVLAASDPFWVSWYSSRERS